MPVGEVKRVVERELGAPISKIFHRFDLQPIGSATIAQVHRAVLQDGRHVAVKVQNTRNKKLMRFDLRNMLFVSRLVDRLRVYLPFDHTSILVEYSTQVRTIHLQVLMFNLTSPRYLWNLILIGRDAC